MSKLSFKLKCNKSQITFKRLHWTVIWRLNRGSEVFFLSSPHCLNIHLTEDTYQVPVAFLPTALQLSPCFFIVLSSGVISFDCMSSTMEKALKSNSVSQPDHFCIPVSFDRSTSLAGTCPSPQIKPSGNYKYWAQYGEVVLWMGPRFKAFPFFLIRW